MASQRNVVAAGPAEMAASPRSEPMRRPGVGAVGKKIKVETNFFRLTAPNLIDIYQYSIEIQAMRAPEPSPRGNRKGGPANGPRSENKQIIDIAPTASIEFNRAVFSSFCKKYLPSTPLAYDGRKTAYSQREIPARLLAVPHPIQADREGPVDRADSASVDKERVETVYVQAKHATTIDIRQIISGRARDTILAGAGLAAIDTVLACGPLRNHVQVGRSFFHRNGEHSLGSGVAAWRGFYQSARLSASGLLVNMDESRTPFWEGGEEPLSSLIKKMNQGQMINTRDQRRNQMIAKTLSGLKVRAMHNKMSYRVFGFSKRGADDTTFFDESRQGEVSVTQYFRAAYNISLRNGRDPCVITNLRRNTVVPLELLTVLPRQRLSKGMTPDQTSKMIKCAATKPHIRKQGALDAIRRVNHNRDPTCQAFGIKIEDRLMTVDARVLPAPSITYRDGPAAPRAGVWDPRHSKKLLKPAPLLTWAVLNLTRTPDRDIQDFISMLTGKAAAMGCPVNRQPKLYHGQEREVEGLMRRIARDFEDPAMKTNNFPLQIILIIKFKQDANVYNNIKRVGDLELGVATQVMLSKHIKPYKPNDSYGGNLLLKMNVKLGGQNSMVNGFNPRTAPNVPFLNERHIILGADVTHPAGGGTRPSVAALVGSRDMQGCQFSGSIRNQPARQELMTDMGDMFLEVYYRWYHHFPVGQRGHVRSIIMFRDGVSEGQFEQVMDHELNAIRRACFQIDPTFNPKITYVIVTKRHHARFFPGRNDAERSGNIPPGTVIDSGVVSSQYYDFYLNSHAGIQGTSRPSKYTVLLDENNIPVDALQGYVYRLAHGYARCNRSVSMVNSAYYAHLLAFRGRAYLGDEDSDSGSTISDSAVPSTANLHDRLGKRLFFV